MVQEAEAASQPGVWVRGEACPHCHTHHGYSVVTAGGFVFTGCYRVMFSLEGVSTAPSSAGC